MAHGNFGGVVRTNFFEVVFRLTYLLGSGNNKPPPLYAVALLLPGANPEMCRRFWVKDVYASCIYNLETEWYVRKGLPETNLWVHPSIQHMTSFVD